MQDLKNRDFCAVFSYFRFFFLDIDLLVNFSGWRIRR